MKRHPEDIRRMAIIVSLILVMAVGLVGCTTISPPPSAPATPTPAPALEAIPSEEPGLEPQPMPINVTLDYFGVKDAHGGNVQVVVIVSDSEGHEEGKCLFPPVKQGYQMGNYETKTINQRVFHTSSAKGDLKISVLAYHRDQSKTEYLQLIQMMEWYYGDGINMLKQLVLNLPENDELIGYYENTSILENSTLKVR